MGSNKKTFLLAQKLKYLLLCCRKYIFHNGFACPSCGARLSQIVDRKYFVTALRRCETCRLLFRTPTTTPDENKRFYQEEYVEGFTTKLPTQEELSALMVAGFKDTQKDYSIYQKILASLGCVKGASLLDFGCSWGYGSWQLKQYGYEVTGFEISKPRGNYARQYLGVDVHNYLDDLKGPFDIFFSTHVLEHVPSVSETIAFAFKILRPGGLFIAVTPNASESYRRRDPLAWHKAWGLVHPNFLDEVYYNMALKNLPRLMASTPYPLEKLEKSKLTKNGYILNELSGEKLLFVARKEN